MRGRRIARVFKIVLLVLTAAAVFTLVTLRLWNWLMPSLFGLHAITYWQALGLLVLSRILLGGFRGRPHFGPPWRHRRRERWQQIVSSAYVLYPGESMDRDPGKAIGALPMTPKMAARQRDVVEQAVVDILRMARLL